MPHFDLVVIGSGSGNSLMTPDLESWNIALVERGVFGGTCLNAGCIPTKMYVYPADLIEAAAGSARLGLHPQRLRADWPAIRDRIFGRIDPIAAGGREYRRTGSANVTLYESHAHFTGKRELRLDTGETLTADQIVLAAGSRVDVPELVSRSGVRYYTSDTVMRLDELPERVVILGGGYVAAEFAHVFSAFGSAVTVVARSQLLRGHDRDVSSRFGELVRDKWQVHTDTVATGLRSEPDGIVVELDDGATVAGDMLLVATGRRPNNDGLDLDAAGVETHPDGRVVVDEYQRTSADGVWALGDLCNEHQLKHVANLEARTVAHNLAHPDDLIAADHRFVPSAVFTSPQIAAVGLTEQDAQARGIPYVSAVQHFSSTAYGWAMEDATGFCKLLADPDTGSLLGAHIMGEQAATLIQPLIQAMSFGLGAREMARGQYWIHPALTEVVENALLALPLS
ncbi:MAG TPA: mycothione reductase [Jatrophihabitans sp.]|nr:mycothione reductase [Jatrophihabitans sp.]